MRLEDGKIVVLEGKRGTYNIGFPGENGADETQFDASGFEELEELWEAFCEENDLDPEDVDYMEREDFQEGEQ